MESRLDSPGWPNDEESEMNAEPKDPTKPVTAEDSTPKPEPDQGPKGDREKKPTPRKD